MSAIRVAKKTRPRSGELSLEPVGLPQTSPDSVFPMLGIGASLGGPASFEAFFSSLPADTDQRNIKDGVRIDRHRLDQGERGEVCDCHDVAGWRVNTPIARYKPVARVGLAQRAKPVIRASHLIRRLSDCRVIPRSPPRGTLRQPDLRIFRLREFGGVS